MSRLAHPPRVVVLATVAFGALVAFWSVSTPLTEAPDEPAHLGLVLHVADTGDDPAYDGLQHTQGLFQMCRDYSTSARWCRTDEEREAGVDHRDRPADAAPPKGARPFWDDPGFQALEPGRMNQIPQHPPLYYRLMATGLRLERSLLPGEMSVDTELAFLRLLNVLLVLPLPWLAWWTGRRLGLASPVPEVAALLPLAVPQLTHIGGTLNNDNLFVVLVSLLVALLAGVARGDCSARTAALVGVTLGLSLLTKGFGVVLPPVVVLAYWQGSAVTLLAASGAWRLADRARPSRVGRRAWGLVDRARRAAVPAIGALGIAFAVSGWWYLGNLLDTGRVMPTVEDSMRLDPDSRPPGFEPDVGEYLGSTVTRLVEGFWGAFGWRRVELPTAVSAAATLLCIAAVVVAFRRSSRASAAPPIPASTVALLVAPLVLFCGFVVVRSAVIYWETSRLAFQQGRYMFGGLTGTAVAVAIAVSARFGPRAVRVTVAGILAMQGMAVATCLAGWWDAADDSPIEALRAVVAWSGWPDPIAVALLAPMPIALAALTAEAWRRPRIGRPAGPTERPGPGRPTAPALASQ